MNIIEWSVIMGGLTAIVWVNWYFFVAPAAAAKRKGKKAESTRSFSR